MTQFNITGMSCAACVARVEKAVNSVDGVNSCSVSLLTNSMGVEGNIDPQKIVSAVENAGYGATLKDEKNTPSKDNALKDTETPKLKKRLIASLGFLAVLMYISM
ncbi:MAG: cation-translocating P-type ATPase, partial [Clostridia bacterium]|nr:cation-translocating P-type ATPase [Clostridia bacterium]